MAILFDLDDTLLDDRGAQDVYLGRLYANHRSEMNRSEPEFRQAWRAAIDRHFQRYVRGEISLVDQRRARVRDAFDRPELGDLDADRIVDEFVAGYEAAWRLFPEVLCVLDALRGIPLGVITNGNGEQQRKKLEQTGILDRFSTVVVSEEIGVAKPSPRIFHHACAALQLAPASCSFVGDDWERDIEGALGAGLGAIWLDRDGTGRRRERIRGEVPRVRSLTEVVAMVHSSSSSNTRPG